jgi:hypothetical protein
LHPDGACPVAVPSRSGTVQIESFSEYADVASNGASVFEIDYRTVRLTSGRLHFLLARHPRKRGTSSTGQPADSETSTSLEAQQSYMKPKW